MYTYIVKLILYLDYLVYYTLLEFNILDYLMFLILFNPNLSTK